MTSEEIRKALEEYHTVEPYHDYHDGELERILNDVHQLQRAVTALVVLLGMNHSINIDDYLHEV